MRTAKYAMADTARTKVEGTTRNPLIDRLVAGRYRVHELIARGGMGSIYRAEQESVGRTVALKVLDIAGAHDAEVFAKRFLLEASVVAKLRHPNTVTVYDYGQEEEGVCFIAMELLDGMTLHQELKKAGTLSPRKTIQIAKQVCNSLREAHRLGVVHRDLKPANIFLVKRPGEDDFVKVLDFGLVKRLDDDATQITAAGVFMGSPRYMAPEQIRGSNVDFRTDIYSLGIVMFEMLAGGSPFDRESAASTMVAQLQQVAPMINEVNPAVWVPAELENIVQRCIAKNPSDRFASMDELLQELDNLGPFGKGNSGAPDPEVSRVLTMKPAVPPIALASIPARSGSGDLAKGALLMLALIGGVLAALNPWDGARKPVETTPLVPLVQAASPEPLEYVTVPEGKVIVTLRSTPPGATVTVGDRSYGPTPAHIVLSGEAAVIGRALEFQFTRAGYAPRTVERRIDAQKIIVDSGILTPASGDSPLQVHSSTK